MKIVYLLDVYAKYMIDGTYGILFKILLADIDALDRVQLVSVTEDATPVTYTEMRSIRWNKNQVFL